MWVWLLGEKVGEFVDVFGQTNIGKITCMKEHISRRELKVVTVSESMCIYIASIT